MKLHSKLFLILLSCIVVFVSVAYILVIHLTQQQTEEEKLDMNYGVLKQTVMSFEYLSDSIERYIFDQCRAEGIASATLQTNNPSILKIQLQSKIQVIGSSPYLLHGFLVDQSGSFFTDAADETAEAFRQLADTDFFDSGDDVEWRDGRRRTPVFETEHLPDSEKRSGRLYRLRDQPGVSALVGGP